MGTQLGLEYFNEIWENVLIMMKERLTSPTFDTWFGGTKVLEYHEDSNQLVIYVPTFFGKSWLENHYTDQVRNTIIALTEHEYQLRFVSDSEGAKQQPGGPMHVDMSFGESIEEETEEDIDRPYAQNKSALNPKYTFESFVIGGSNRFAHAASLAVAERPANSYNPLFLYGGVGLGKTHLMHAIGHFVKKINPSAKVLYISSERFTNEFIKSIMDNSTGEFRERYRSIDVLLVDDIQFLAKKESTQEEFFHTFNTLHEHNKQIVISSDRTPREIPTLEDRLRSRFEWGLIIDIQPPDLETRIAILQRKAKADGLHVPNEVTQYIAAQVESNIRELEGALIRVVAYSSLVNQDLHIGLAEEALKDIIAPNNSRTITVSQIQKVIGDHYGLKLDDFKAKKRTRNIAFPRQIAMYLTRELTDMSLPRIGEAFGGRDHTTVLHACDKVNEEIQDDVQLKQTILRLSEAIRTLH